MQAFNELLPHSLWDLEAVDKIIGPFGRPNAAKLHFPAGWLCRIVDFRPFCHYLGGRDFVRGQPRLFHGDQDGRI